MSLGAFRMFNPSSSAVYRVQRRLTDFRSFVDRIDESDELRREELRFEFEAVVESELLEENNRLQDLIEKVRTRLSWDQRIGTVLTSDEKHEILSACDEMRLQMLASLMYKEQLDSFSSEVSEDIKSFLEPESDERMGISVHGLGGVTSSLVMNNMIILFPQIASERQLNDVLYELHTIYEHTPQGVDWIVDFSAIDVLPMKILGSLLILEDRLRFRRHGVFFCWVKPEVFPANWEKRMIRIFNLKRVGGRWFSERA